MFTVKASSGLKLAVGVFLSVSRNSAAFGGVNSPRLGEDLSEGTKPWEDSAEKEAVASWAGHMEMLLKAGKTSWLSAASAKRRPRSPTSA